MDSNQTHLRPPHSSHSRAVAASRWISAILMNLCWFLIVVALILSTVDYINPNAIEDGVISSIFTSGCLCGILAFMTPCCDNFQTHTRRPVLRPQMAEITVRRGSQPDFFQNMHIARLASASLLVLPPVKTFENGGGSHGGAEVEGSVRIECVVCLEEFKNGELIQPFPKCKHEFHTSCINSWLLGGKITCPICRFSLKDILSV